YRQRSPYSAIHLELPVATNGIGPYERAAELLAAWLRDAVLLPQDAAAYYVHRQEFAVRGIQHGRTALLAGVRLEPWEAGVVLPHERTFRGPKQDRLQLLRATAVAPSSVFSLYEQPNVVRAVIEVVTREAPLTIAAEGGVTHKLWRIGTTDHIEAVAEAMAKQKLYIADGHHRYETALAYRDECRATEPTASEDRAYNYLAMSLVAFDDPGLIVQPTHRLVQGAAPDAVADLRAWLSTSFDVEIVQASGRSEEELQALLDGGQPYAFLVYDGRDLLRITADERMRGELPQDRSEAWRELDLAALHELVLGRALNIPADMLEAHVAYSRDVPRMFEQVESGEAQLACFVRPTDVRQLRAVADASDKMPQKSTYFYPKFPAGLVINRLDVTLPSPLAVRS
ncbi:MAG: DUF1015 domain-containing protein, partial [Chloroflexota bacterium]|nr:DUF1015 domain-containing protein [Chloroflexota bacterium]